MAHQESVDIVVAGHICFDLIPAFPKRAGAPGGAGRDFASLMIPGKLINVAGLATSTGGPVSNTGLALKRLGVRVALMGKVGDDFIGRAIIERLAQEGFSGGMQVVAGEESSYTVVISPPGIDRLFLHNPGANNTFGADDIDYSLVESAKLFHLGYPPLMQRLYANDGDELAEIFRRVKALPARAGGGVTTCLDMALPDPHSPAGSVNWRRVLERTVRHVDLFLPSVEETLFMLHKERFMAKKNEAGARDMIDLFEAPELTALSGELLDMGGTIIGIKCGYKGFYLRTTSEARGERREGSGEWWGRELWEPSYHVPEIASATGSGDSAIAGFLAAYVRGLSAEQTLRYACAAGGHNVQVLDAVSGIKSWQETTADIDRGWEKNALEISAPGWRFDAERSLWHGPHDAADRR